MAKTTASPSFGDRLRTARDPRRLNTSASGREGRLLPGCRVGVGIRHGHSETRAAQKAPLPSSVSRAASKGSKESTAFLSRPR